MKVDYFPESSVHLRDHLPLHPKSNKCEIKHEEKVLLNQTVKYRVTVTLAVRHHTDMSIVYNTESCHLFKHDTPYTCLYLKTEWLTVLNNVIAK